MVGCWFKPFTYHEGTNMRHRLIPAALAAGASLALLAGPAMAATPTWTVVPSVSPSATTLSAVSARTATDAGAAGQVQGAGDDAGLQIFAERWNGTQWQQVPTPTIVRQDERLLGVSASGPDDAWAVGNTNSISAASHDTLAAHWDGTAWTIMPTPTPTPTPAAASGQRPAPAGWHRCMASPTSARPTPGPSARARTPGHWPSPGTAPPGP
jgi:hypothetical protein